MTTRVAVVGANGRMGTLASRIVEQTDYTIPEPGRIGDVFVAGGG